MLYYKDFTEVEKLITSPDSNRSFDLLYLEDSIVRFQNTHGLDLDPEFQRGHVWTEEQQRLYVEFVLRGGHQNPILFNHPSWGNFTTKGMVLVDGKQRLTALLKFLKNNLRLFPDKFSPEGYLMNDIKNIPYYKYGIPYAVNSLRSHKLVVQWYLELNSGGTPHSEDELLRVRNLLIMEK